MLFNKKYEKIVMIRDIVIDENLAWNCNLVYAINKPFRSYVFDESLNEVKVKQIIDILVEVQAISEIPYTIEVEEGVAITSQRPQRTNVQPT